MPNTATGGVRRTAEGFRSLHCSTILPTVTQRFDIRKCIKNVEFVKRYETLCSMSAFQRIALLDCDAKRA